MKFLRNNNRALPYLAAIYFVTGVLFFSYVARHTRDELLWAVSALCFVMVVVLTHEPLHRRLGQLVGRYQPNTDVGYFAAFVEFNRRIHNVLEISDVLMLLSDTLRQNIGVHHVRYLFNRELPLRGESASGPEHNRGEALTLRTWPLERIWHFHTEEFEREVLAQASVMTKANAPPSVQRAFEESHTELIVPLVQDHRLLGVLLIGRGENKPPFGDFDVQMFDYLMRQVALIVDRIRVYGEVLRKTRMEHAERMQVMQSLSASIAHEMRTPLAGIRASVSGLEEYLPPLLASHSFAVTHAPEQFSPIRDAHLHRLQDTPQRIMLMIDQANTVSDMVLMNLREQALDRGQLDLLNAAAVITQAVERYPFRSGERERVHLDLREDFPFRGVETFFVYVLFNLLKNALYSLQSAQRGRIVIRLERGASYNTVYFRDTGSGIEPAIINKIFDGFFTTKRDGTGAGLAFCKRTILSFGGEIQCDSVLGEYAEFVIRLPVVLERS